MDFKDVKDLVRSVLSDNAQPGLANIHGEDRAIATCDLDTWPKAFQAFSTVTVSLRSWHGC